MPELKPVGVIGLGVVGSAVRHYFEEVRREEVLLYDPYKRLGSAAEISQASLVFICVPTPYLPGSGFDDTAVAESLALLQGRKTVVIKSTVLPGTTAAYQRRYPQHSLMFNPEFLRERSALQDFLCPDRQLVGCGDGQDEEGRELLELLPAAPYAAVLPSTAAELIKYATNAFLALKVVFANEMYDLSGALGIDYEELKRGLGADPRIGTSHLDVLDGGYRGYDGKCLPKDTLSLIDLGATLGAPLRLIETAHDVNQALQAEKPQARRPRAAALAERHAA